MVILGYMNVTVGRGNSVGGNVRENENAEHEVGMCLGPERSWRLQ